MFKVELKIEFTTENRFTVWTKNWEDEWAHQESFNYQCLPGSYLYTGYRSYIAAVVEYQIEEIHTARKLFLFQKELAAVLNED